MPIDRREFLASGAAAFLPVRQATKQDSQKDSEKDSGQKNKRPQVFRTITYNVLACRGYPRTKGNASFLKRAARRMAERFAIELELYDPDVVTFQESPKRELVAAIAKHLGYAHCYFPGGFPGSVLTKHDIVAHENCPLVEGGRPDGLYTRHWGRARLRVHGERITLYSAHLHPSRAATRAREVTGMLAVMKRDLAAGGSFLFQGDLNHEPSGPEYARWQELGWVDTFRVKGKGQPLTIPSTKPRSRIDYVLAHGPIVERLEECRVLFEGPFRTNRDDPRSFALSDHIPVMATFRRA